MASFGEELKRERELRDISLKEISEATKISIRFLEALEQNNFDILPGGIFNRGFIRAYARFIGIDGEEMVNAYLHEVSVREAKHSSGRGEARGGPRAPERRQPPHPEPRQDARQAPRPADGAAEGRTSFALWALAVIAFLVGATIVVLSFFGGDDEPRTAPAEEVQQTAAAPPGRTGAVRPTPAESPVDLAPIVAAVGETPGAGAAPSTDPGTPPAPEETQQQAPTGPEVPRHKVRVLVTEATRVRIDCADTTALDQELWPGQTRTLTCVEPVVLSADNAGAVQYAIDDSPPLLLGGIGERIEWFIAAPRPPGDAEDTPQGSGPGVPGGAHAGP